MSTERGPEKPDEIRPSGEWGRSLVMYHRGNRKRKRLARERRQMRRLDKRRDERAALADQGQT